MENPDLNAGSLWRSPRYPFRILPAASPDSDPVEIWIDVTGSAPRHDAPGKVLENIFTQAIAHVGGRKALNILDLGAGKLRNTLFLLAQGHRVDAVEFEAAQRLPQGRTALDEARKFGTKFQRCFFPHEFVASQKQYDLILLVNVISIMPVPAERLLLLVHCYQRLKETGRLLWYAQYGDQDERVRCKEENRIGDGYFLGVNNNYKTFYRQFKVPELDDILLACGFLLDKTLSGAGKNQARLYRKIPSAPLADVITQEMIETAGLIDPSIKAPERPSPRAAADGEARSPDDPDLSLPELLRKRLRTLKAGRKTATTYEYLAACLISFLFRGHLVNLTLQMATHEGRQRVDFVLTNSATSGLFENLVQKHRFLVPYVFFECKNYVGDPDNPEFDQLKGRLGGHMGEVGFLLCRKIVNRKAMLKRQQDALGQNKLILVLSDDDLEALLDKRLAADDDGFSNYLDELVKDVIFKR
ncbi:MAG TPA: class I SAM-dependent methyltransferase [Thermoanaerobaculia bacterium]|jgi:hypothetical protein|nr:class I SAM-dependent methyltransferase [Thermoanaerobaculia bacterium]